METICYIEINLLCIIILLLIGGRVRKKHGQFSTDKLIFNALLWLTIVFCASDMAAGILRGRQFFGARFLIQLSNTVYFEALAGISYLWAIYVRVKLRLLTELSLKNLLAPSIPLLIITAAAITNPFTHLLFSVDSLNLYKRGAGVYLYWAVNWLYLIVPTLRVALACAREKNRLRRQELLPMLGFIIAPAAASVAQMLFYGITTSQAGITISVLAIFILSQDDQILTDSLTGLNNRRGFENYIADRVTRHPDAQFMIVMLDLNCFKQVNDRYGHIVGDRTLINTAEILKRVCTETPRRLFLCRYGGDEFLLCGDECSEGDGILLADRIREGFATASHTGLFANEQTVSIGVARGNCSGPEQFLALISEADKAMYEEKQRFKENAVRRNEIGNM